MNSREKGKRGERMAAAKWRESGFDARRGVQYRGEPDSPDVIGPPGVHIEVKFTERLHLWDALAQSKRDAGPDEMPIVMHKANGTEWVVIQPFDDWVELYKANEWEKVRREIE